MKNMKRALRRNASQRKLLNTIDTLYQICTGVDTRAEMKRIVIKRNHCEQTGRRFDGLKNWKMYATANW